MAANIQLRERSLASGVIVHYSSSPKFTLYIDGVVAHTIETQSNSNGGITYAEHGDTYKTCHFTCPAGKSGYVFHLISDESDLMVAQIVTEPISQYRDKVRVISADVQYTGAPKVDFDLDGVARITSPDHNSTNGAALTDVTSPHDVSTVTLYFGPDCIGYVPHAVSTLSGQILNVTFNTEPI